MPTTTNVPQVKVNVMDEDTFDSIQKSPTEFYAVTDAKIKTSELDNDEGFITSAALSGYATENWVVGQGYLTGITSLMVTTALGYTPQVAGNYMTTDTAQDVTAAKTFKNGGNSFEGSVWNDVLTVKRTLADGGVYLTFENGSGDLGNIGISASGKPLWINIDNTENAVLVRAGRNNTPAVGNSSTPIYVDSNGKAQECTGVETKTTVVALADSSTIEPATNTIYNGGTLTALTITLPSTVTNSYTTEIDFTSGATATTFTYPNTMVWLDGDDTDSGVFTPVTNKRYTCIIWYDGTQYVGIERGVE